MSTSSLVRKVEKDALAPVGGGRKFSSFTRARDKEPAEPSWRSKQQGRSQVGEAKDKGKNKFDAVRGDGAGANLLGTMKGGRRLGGKLVRQRSTGDGKGKGGGGKRNESGRGSIGGAAILSLLEAGKQEGAGPRIVAAKSSPWRKLIVSTPVHGEWRAPAEYAAAGSSSSMWGAAGDDDDDDDGPPSTEGEGEMQEDELADVSDGELVYDDEMFVEESLVPRAEQRARSVFSSSNVSSSSAQSPCLRFESRFESGNLRKAYRVGDLEYRLYMRDDVCLSSQGSRVFNCTQWFYFRVLNGLSSKLYTLSLLNFIKPDSLYKDGMQPLLYSREEERRTGKGWHRVGESISYQANVRQFHKNGQVNNFFTLRFSLQLPYDDDECYLAMCYPYTYHDLQRHLLELQSDSLRSQRLRRCELCKTIAGNVLDLVMIGNDLQVKKPSLVITARVHPGESNASLIMHGLLDYLTGPSHHAHELRRAFSFFVVPMLNPDGVILGNYRCSLSGHDLNRQWIEPDAQLHPEISSVKRLCKELAMANRLVLFLDIHGHSCKKGFFLYCCEDSVSGLPWAMSRRSAFYSLGNTTYKIGKSKVNTGRAVVYNELGCIDSYTCEASFLGSEVGGAQSLHFNEASLRNVGAQIAESLSEYLLPGLIEPQTPGAWH